MSPDVSDLKRWTTARAMACRVGVIACRTDLADGPRLYFTIRFGVPRQHAHLAALEEYVAGIAREPIA